MRKANFIKNNFYKTDDGIDKSGVISITYVEYSDNTSEVFQAFNPITNGNADEKWKRILENKIENYQDFITNKEKWREQGLYKEKVERIKFFEPETIANNQLLIGDVEKVRIYRLIDENVDLALVELYDANGEIYRITCKYEDISAILRSLLSNYDKIVKKGKIEFVNEEKNRKFTNSNNYKMSEISFVVSDKKVDVYVTYADDINDKSYLTSVSLKRGLEKVKKYPETKVSYIKIEDGKPKSITEKEFHELIANFEEDNIDILKNKKNNNILISDDELEERERFEEQSRNTGYSYEKDKSLTTDQKIAIGVAGLSAGVLLLCGAIKLFKKEENSNVKLKSNSSSQTDSSSTKDTNNEQNNKLSFVHSEELNEFLLKVRESNESRYNFYKSVNDTLGLYNLVDSFTLRDTDKETRLAHSIEEIEAEYLLYNDVSGEEIHKIFGNTRLEQEELVINFENAMKEDAHYHNLHHTGIYDKSQLLRDEKSRAIYSKYYFLFSNMNSVSYKEEKKAYMKKFYDMVRKDLGIAAKATLDSSKLVILEFIRAMENMNITVENSFTKEEKDYIDNMYNKYIVDKFSNIARTQNARVIIESDNSKIEEETSLKKFEELEVNELTNSCAYYLDRRDITNYDSYIRNTNGLEYTYTTTTTGSKETTTSIDSRGANESSRTNSEFTRNNTTTNNYATTKSTTGYTGTYRTINSRDMIPSQTGTNRATTKSTTKSTVPSGTVDPRDMVTAPSKAGDQIFTNNGATTTTKSSATTKKTTNNPYADLIITKEIDNSGKTLVLKR